MTNITFTKGIGTPKYMAPEILDRKKYKMPADIYSFAITMLEIYLWSEAFPKSELRFAWNIADYISSGKRPKGIQMIHDKNIKEMIEQSWCDDPKERLTIEDIVSLLETSTIKFDN